MKQQDNIRIILEGIIDKQLKHNQPPETLQTYNRLVDNAYTDEEARLLISRALQIELYRLMRFAEPFNKNRFLKNLHQLPDLPDVD